ncbi:transketolase [Pseudomonas sp. CrR25]|nr:transketolase [Pseudomonas sp. CrR25]
MHAISESAVWVKEPFPDVGVVIITTAALPKYIIDKLHIAIEDWTQVAYLVVKQSSEFMLDWLRAESIQADSSPPTTCHASQLLSSVSKGCYLLDIEACPLPSLTWLGSVCGHKLRFIKLGKIELSNAAMDRHVDNILSEVRTLAKKILEERYIVE